MFHPERWAAMTAMGGMPDEKTNPEAYKKMIEFLAKPDAEDLADARDSGMDNPTWRPYCMNCPTFRRMKRTDIGHHCDNCGRDIGHAIPGTGTCYTQPGVGTPPLPPVIYMSGPPEAAPT